MLFPVSDTLCAVGRKIPEGYMSVDEAAAVSGISRRWLFELVKRGRLRSYRLVGVRPTLLKRAEVDALDEPQAQDE